MHVNGINLEYDERGEGEPILLIHGHPFDRSMWRPQLEHFGARHRVIAPDLRGYGASTVVPGKTPLDVFAKDLAALLDGLGIERVVLGGLSMGGQIVLEFHRLFPGRVRALVLADTSAEAETPEGVRARNAMADRLLREGMSGYAEEVRYKMVSRDNPATAELVAGMMHAAPPEGAAAALRGRAERPSYVDMLATVRVPSLVVVGEQDEFTPLADARLLHDRIPGSRLLVVPGAAHMPNLERPDVFNSALEELLAEVTS
ncbi:alpha/beta fold hydrolase [Amycolatopsis sp. NPDC059021]|uniref:alpha/beta fold hydrolase n=1 Tax=Amycolatopsis sp. NPDC059021 TaxID=3346704 RepID=UPI00366FE4BF